MSDHARRTTVAKPQRTSTPCRTCNNLDPRGHSSTFYDTESTSRSIASLTLIVDALSLKRSRENCPRCHLVAEALDAHSKDWKTSRPPVLLELTEHAPIRITLQLSRSSSEKVEIYASSNTPRPWSTLGCGHSIPKHADSDGSLRFAKKAIEDCVKNHKSLLCGQSRRDKFVPSRLIHIDENNTDTKLCESPPQNAKYVALSHCWGYGPPFTTTIATLEERKSGIDYDCLPPLFQDAIFLTEELGIKYLWIDALCIIQDSREDWETESVNMSNIYENAYVTIAATSSNSNDREIFSARPRATKLHYQANPRTKVYTVRARKMPNHHPTIGEDQSPARPMGPLMSRAWALQEHVLCSRILHFTSTEILFECGLAYCCECMPSPKRFMTTPGLLPRLLTTGKKRSYWKTWHQIVTQFSTRDLTIPSDKLPAISGIAKKFREPTRSAYIAGLWRDNLVEDLLWSSDRSLQPPHAARRLSVYRAPSFSWASVDTQIQYYEPDRASEKDVDSLVTIYEACTSLTGRNTLGAVKDGWIRLKGPVVEATLIAPEEYSFSYQLFRTGNPSIDVAPDSLLVTEDVDHATTSPLPQQESPTKTSNYADATSAASNDSPTTNPAKTVRRARPAEIYTSFKAPVLCLGIARYEGSWISGIVLGLSGRTMGEADAAASTQEMRCYERLGTFSAGEEWFQGAEKREMFLV
ncbi:uncharacterized protein K452DRAFT_350467 [Aplosporella prunicola CBS 121167]|uniref:Heterokaryon incompatibility domain-containing protein n=1 Tax=Aplosporella prunicola CBS 121167 TaxID=1176127 RepID=A0A6A6BH51_9PEZI|nr:uncharacterized protein K452DRAFT_350467 [Aplosporella prunicola CBS 121167]KAF2143460.1 hypothetical protein K452DRAFT_350467 [Aplosporella prunicola CBS 121167]